MTKPPLATTISSLLVGTMIVTPTVTFAEDGYRGTVRGVAESETQRRQEYVQRGEAAIEAGKAAMKDRDYEKATAYFKNAADLIPDSPNTHGLHRDAVDHFCDASIKLANELITEGRYQQAQDTLQLVLDERYDPHCKKAVVLLSHLEQPDYFNKTITPKFRGNVEQVKQWFIEAQGLYDTGRLDLAKQRCEHILNVDPYNRAAREFEEKIERARDDYGIAAYNHTRAKQVADVDNAWAMPVRKFNIQTEAVVTNGPLQPSTEKIRRKLERIIIPKLEFREATIREAIEFLKKKSVELDDESPAGEKGVNIVLKLEGAAGPAAAPGAPAAPPPGIPGIPGLEAAPPAPGAAPAAAASTSPADVRITVSLTNIPLIEALKYVTGLANLKFKVEPYAVSVVPLSEPTDVLVTKEWKIPPDLIPRTPGAGGAAASALTAPAFTARGGGGAATDTTRGGVGIADRESAKNWLIANGVQFNGNASAIYIVKSSRLIVRNTQDQLDLVDQIITSGNTGEGPVQVEIEAKFIEIQQNNLKELSFDVLLGQAHIPGNNNVFFGGGTTGTSPALNSSDFPFVAPGTGPVGTNGGAGTLTAGNQSGNLAISADAINSLLFPSLGASSLAPAIAGLAGVFSDPQFQIVMRGLNQKKGVDLLSSPKVTTKSGQRAVIEVIREFRYPTEFTPPQIPQTFQTPLTTGIGVASASNSSFPVTPTTPTAFETRNTGVTLEVEPVVGPDGYTIDLNLVPQVVEFEGFINYGSPITSTSTNPITGVSSQQTITPNVINQPIFSTRKVTTSVSVYDGSTVVLGGLIREDVQKVEDKTPLLGDIPILGRLFRSSVDQHLKTNLIMFVTARLINAAGEPVRSDEEKDEVVETVSPPQVAPIELPLMPK
ncbi:MAG TPA: Amuc_1098 family type IV pilus outer membrane protein [Chthoniobacter sp.]|jgi:general secretion pathway protein D